MRDKLHDIRMAAAKFQPDHRQQLAEQITHMLKRDRYEAWAATATVETVRERAEHLLTLLDALHPTCSVHVSLLESITYGEMRDGAWPVDLGKQTFKIEVRDLSAIDRLGKLMEDE